MEYELHEVYSTLLDVSSFVAFMLIIMVKIFGVFLSKLAETAFHFKANFGKLMSIILVMWSEKHCRFIARFKSPWGWGLFSVELHDLLCL